jgi:hypothetical protein
VHDFALPVRELSLHADILDCKKIVARLPRSQRARIDDVLLYLSRFGFPLLFS